MEINLLVFGQIADITGKQNRKVSGVQTTDELKQKLESEYAALKSVSYSIAVNKVIIKNNTTLSNEDTVALLPPFSGG